MTAKEALELSTLSCKNDIESTYIKIKQSTEKGECKLRCKIQDGTINKLQKDGFTVEIKQYEVSGERIVYDTTISWFNIY